MAFKHYSETNRCELFETLATWVWNKIIDAHRVKKDDKEIGITSDLVVKILNDNLSYPSNFDVFVKEGWNEKDYGSDLDVFVEVESNKYKWFALQAKLLKKNNEYDQLRHYSKDQYQWEKLDKLEKSTACKAYYLLFNGSSSFISNQLTDCKGDFDVSQYGCSLVETSVVKELANRKIGSSFKNPTFEDFHPSHAKPWRMLTCCHHKKNTPLTYSYNQIVNSNTYLIDITDLNPLDDIEAVKQTEQNPEDAENPITIASKNADWNPDIRLVISFTQSL